MNQNLDPNFHPLESLHEYLRSVNAAKLEKIFAKPFVGALEHTDCITSMSTNPKSPNSLLTGSSDGDIRLWEVAARRPLARLVGHTKAVRGLSVAYDGESCVSCSEDCTVRLWKLGCAPFELGPVVANQACSIEFPGKEPYHCIDHHPKEQRFLTAGTRIELWEDSRQFPLQSFSSTTDSVLSVRFNPFERGLFVASAADRSIALYDLRLSRPVQRFIMKTSTNALAWNRIEAFNFTAANEDSNLYTYDIRKLKTILCIHKDFVSSVLDLDYSPTGREFVAGSYDRSIRIYPHISGHSRQIYHTKRMMRVLSVRFSVDGDYVFSGSDDMNVRVWKAHASKRQIPLLPAEKRSQAYNCALISRYQHFSELNRICKTSRIPKSIFKTSQLKRTIAATEQRKLTNVIIRDRPKPVRHNVPRKKKILVE